MGGTPGHVASVRVTVMIAIRVRMRVRIIIRVQVKGTREYFEECQSWMMKHNEIRILDGCGNNDGSVRLISSDFKKSKLVRILTMLDSKKT